MDGLIGVFLGGVIVFVSNYFTRRWQIKDKEKELVLKKEDEISQKQYDIIEEAIEICVKFDNKVMRMSSYFKSFNKALEEDPHATFPYELYEKDQNEIGLLTHLYHESQLISFKLMRLENRELLIMFEEIVKFFLSGMMILPVENVKSVNDEYIMKIKEKSDQLSKLIDDFMNKCSMITKLKSSSILTNK
jgi:gas vesicle protein